MTSLDDNAIRKSVDYRSIDSQPLGLSTHVSTLRAPAVLITFSLLSVIQLWLFQTGLYDGLFPHGDYIFSPYFGDHGIAIRAYIISFYIAYSLFASGRPRARLHFAADVILRFLAVCATIDLLNTGMLTYFDAQFPLTVVQILAGLVGLGLFSFMLLERGAMPEQRPVKTGEQRNLLMLLRLLVTFIIAAFFAGFVASLDSPIVKEMKSFTLLGGIGPGVFLLLPALFLQLYVIGVVERWLFASKDFAAPISVIVPAFNEEHIIAETIRHIDAAAQDYPQAIELIVLDNNSRDNTAAIATKAIKSARWIEGRVIHIARAGKAHALNQGVEEARYDLILRIDADTQIRADNIVLAAQNFHNPKLGVVGGVPVPPGGGMFDRARLVEVTVKHGFYSPALSAFSGLVGVPGMFALYRAEALRRAGPFATGMNGEDTDISLRIVELGYNAIVDRRVRYVSEVPATMAHMREQRLRWFRSVYHVAARGRDAFSFERSSIRGKLVLPYMLLNSARRGMMVPILIFGMFQLFTNTGGDSGLVWQSIIAVLVGAPALLAVFVLLINREWYGLLCMPEYLAFRVLRAWYTLESLLTIRISRSVSERKSISAPPSSEHST